MTQPFDLIKYLPGEFETEVLATVFKLSTTTIQIRTTSFAVWGKPQLPGHIQLYYCWQATKMLAGDFGMPETLAEKDEFLAHIFNGYRKISRTNLDAELELVHMIEVTVRAFAEKYVAETEPKKIPRFEAGHWAWHIRKGLPVVIIYWRKNYCRIAIPVTRKNGNVVLDMEVHGRPSTDPIAIGHYSIVDFDYEPSFLIPLHLEPFKKAKAEPEPVHGMNPDHGMNKPYS